MKRQNPRVNLGLAIAGATLQPGQSRTLREIAAYCGCSMQAVQEIERTAMRKLRNRLMRESAAGLSDDLLAVFQS
jgi:hypothetical protein